MRKMIILILIVCSALSALSAQDNIEYRKALTVMMQRSGSFETFKAGVNQIIIIYKKNFTKVPPSIWDELKEEFLKTSMDDLIDMLQPVYQKYLTINDLEVISEFYNTEPGRKLAANLPAITQESMLVGAEWGKIIAARIENRLKEKGYE